MVPDRDVLAVVLHDAVCPDRRCDPQVFGDEFKRADALLASDWLVAITAEHDALAAKVAGVSELADKWEANWPESTTWTQGNRSGTTTLEPSWGQRVLKDCATDLRAALDAS